MKRVALVLAGALIGAGLLGPAPAGAVAVPDRGNIPGYVRIVGPVHTSFIAIKVNCVAGTTATVEHGSVSQPHDPFFGDPLGNPAPTNVSLTEQGVSLPCTGREKLVRLPLAPMDCPDDRPACGARPGLVRGVNADVQLGIAFELDDVDYPALDVRVVGR